MKMLGKEMTRMEFCGCLFGQIGKESQVLQDAINRLTHNEVVTLHNCSYVHLEIMSEKQEPVSDVSAEDVEIMKTFLRKCLMYWRYDHKNPWVWYILK